MEGETIVQLVTIISSAVVAIITLLVRSRVIGLEKEVVDLRATIASAHALILDQYDDIKAFGAVKIPVAEKMPKPTKGEDWTANPPYRAK